jgi:DNA-binding response OmpR family regulator
MTTLNKLVAVVDDDEDVRALVRAGLQKERFLVREYSDGKGFLASLDTERPDLVVLDVLLPDVDGFDICRLLNENDALGSISVIILTARTEEVDRLVGLSLGADDYVVKPFSIKELVARVKAVLRRSEPKSSRARVDAGGGLFIDVDRMEAFFNGEPLELTLSEFYILKLLSSRIGWVFSREEILHHLWVAKKRATKTSVKVHMKRLRDKLGTVGKRIVYVQNGGYRLLRVDRDAPITEVGRYRPCPWCGVDVTTKLVFWDRDGGQHTEEGCAPLKGPKS